MKRFRALLLSALLLWVPAFAVAEGRPSLAEQAALQAAMQLHVDRQTIDGTLPYLDQQTGEMRLLHPVTAHPMILAMGPHFVLCFDFRDDAGQPVPVDYYMTRNGKAYTIFHTAVSDRALLTRLIDGGQVQRLP